jgi:hypothetical protein
LSNLGIKLCHGNQSSTSTYIASTAAPTATRKAATLISTTVLDSNLILSDANALGIFIGSIGTPARPYHPLTAPRGGGGLENPVEKKIVKWPSKAIYGVM